MSVKILAINPGSTSTKIAIYENEDEKFVKNIKHPAEEIAKFNSVASQFEFRKDIILSELKAAGFDINEIDAIVGRGGLVKPIESGVYEVNEALIDDLNNPPLGEHASNLGGLIACDIAKTVNNGAKAYIADPVVVDELQDVARISGHPLFKRVSIFHALNQFVLFNDCQLLMIGIYGIGTERAGSRLPTRSVKASNRWGAGRQCQVKACHSLLPRFCGQGQEAACWGQRVFLEIHGWFTVR